MQRPTASGVLLSLLDQHPLGYSYVKGELDRLITGLEITEDTNSFSCYYRYLGDPTYLNDHELSWLRPQEMNEREHRVFKGIVLTYEDTWPLTNSLAPYRDASEYLKRKLGIEKLEQILEDNKAYFPDLTKKYTCLDSSLHAKGGATSQSKRLILCDYTTGGFYYIKMDGEHKLILNLRPDLTLDVHSTDPNYEGLTPYLTMVLTMGVRSASAVIIKALALGVLMDNGPDFYYPLVLGYHKMSFSQILEALISPCSLATAIYTGKKRSRHPPGSLTDFLQELKKRTRHTRISDELVSQLETEYFRAHSAIIKP